MFLLQAAQDTLSASSGIAGFWMRKGDDVLVGIISGIVVALVLGLFAWFKAIRNRGPAPVAMGTDQGRQNVPQPTAKEHRFAYGAESPEIRPVRGFVAEEKRIFRLYDHGHAPITHPVMRTYSASDTVASRVAMEADLSTSLFVWAQVALLLIPLLIGWFLPDASWPMVLSSFLLGLFVTNWVVSKLFRRQSL